MKKITIIIPTRNRINKLRKTLDSIPNYDWIETIVGVDNELITDKALLDFNKDMILHPFYNPDSFEPYGSIFIRNNLIEQYVTDGLIYATDDIIFEEDSIVKAKECFNDNFKDEDGIVGFIQKPSNQFHPTGVGLVGQKFLQRYPNKWLFNPDYFHFACQEIYQLAEKYDKFKQCKEAIVWHYNPAKFEKEMDKTHEDARKFKKQDHKLMKERKQKGLIWGDE